MAGALTPQPEQAIRFGIVASQVGHDVPMTTTVLHPDARQGWVNSPVALSATLADCPHSGQAEIFFFSGDGPSSISRDALAAARVRTTVWFPSMR